MYLILINLIKMYAEGFQIDIKLIGVAHEVKNVNADIYLKSYNKNRFLNRSVEAEKFQWNNLEW